MYSIGAAVVEGNQCFVPIQQPGILDARVAEGHLAEPALQKPRCNPIEVVGGERCCRALHKKRNVCGIIIFEAKDAHGVGFPLPCPLPVCHHRQLLFEQVVAPVALARVATADPMLPPVQSATA